MLLLPSGDNKEYETGTTAISVQENSSTSITCKSIGSLPAVELLWTLGDTRNIPGNTSMSKHRSAMDEGLFDTESTIAIRPERKHHGQFLQCFALLGTFFDLRVAKLIVYSPPDLIIMTSSDDLRDGMPSNLSCRAINGYPAPLVHWYIGSTNLTDGSFRKASVKVDDRYDVESTLTLIPKRFEHGKRLFCKAVQPTTLSLRPVIASMVLNISYSPVIVNISARRLKDDKDFIGIKFTCISDSNPPALNFSWFRNGTILFNSSKLLILQSEVHSGTISTGSLIIHNVRPSNSGKYECLASTDLGNDTASLHYSLIPDTPFWFIVDQNQTTSSSFYVAWQPGFHGGLPQTFTLKYCANDTQVQGEGCDRVTNLTRESYRLTGLKPFTWYRLTLWAVNSAGNSSPVEVVTSTAPLPPESYGVTITRHNKSRTLIFSKANQSVEEICFFVQSTSHELDCSSVDGTDGCIKSDTKVSFKTNGAPIVVTSGRGLCSEPADLADSPQVNQPSLSRSSQFMTIVFGVVASAGVILLISVGLTYFHGVLCCAKLKKEGNAKIARPAGQTVDDDGLVYTSVAHDRDHPPNAPPIQTEEATVYASLNSEAMKCRKGELKYSDTKATTPDGQPMYGNYLVKKRKQEQANMPPPVQTDGAPHSAAAMACYKGDMKFGEKGPVTPDGQPMYGNYLVKMRKEEKAKQIAGTPDVFQMYGI